jgi:hypothetical protein
MIGARATDVREAPSPVSPNRPSHRPFPSHDPIDEPVRSIEVVGARGGQGTSTIACVLALLEAANQQMTLVTADPTATAALLGVPARPTDEEIEITSACGWPRRFRSRPVRSWWTPDAHGHQPTRCQAGATPCCAGRATSLWPRS